MNEKTRKPNSLLLTTLLIAILLSSVAISPVVIGAESGTGQVVIGIQTPTLVSRSIAISTGGSNLTIDSALTVNTDYWFNVTVSCASALISIKNVTILIYDSTGTKGTFDKQHSYGFRYENVSGTAKWYELTATGWVSSETYITNATCVEPTLTGSSDAWKFYVKYGKVGDHTDDTNEWHYYAYCNNSAGQSVQGDDIDWFEFGYYREFTMAGASIDWGTLNPADTNQTATTPASGNQYVNIVAINHVSDVQWKGDADLQRTGGSGTSFPLANIYIGQTSNSATNDGIKLTTNYANLWDDITAGTESTQKAGYSFITVPNPCVDGTYTFTWYAEIIED